jgi:signal transduction histidine kinase/ActR/RegA family two-component response regulator
MGTIGLLRSAGRPPHDADTEAFIIELAYRAALAIDNAHLNEAETAARRRAEAEATERERLFGEVTRELAERRQVERRLAEADRRKDEFLAMLAHELRNPLAPVQLAVQVLQKGDPSPERVERCHEIIARQTELLARLLDDLLDVSRITRGKIELRKQPLPLASVVSRAIDAVRMLVERARHEVVVSLPERPVYVFADPVRLEQVLVNLLTNAAKYTDPGGRIALAVERAGDMVEVRVRDNGIGIAPEMLGRVFDLFVQGDRGLARTQGGLGIGLTVVRSVVDLHRGTVEARSGGAGQGTEFVVRLPVIAEQAPVSPESAGRSEQSATPRRVLVVDDNQDIVEMLASVLSDWGHEVESAGEGPRALELARDFRPELVILDIGLPGMDGYELARRLREELGEAPCMVALTGYGQERDRQLARAAGFAHHLIKPLGLDRLADILAELPARPAAPAGP